VCIWSITVFSLLESVSMSSWDTISSTSAEEAQVWRRRSREASGEVDHAVTALGRLFHSHWCQQMMGASGREESEGLLEDPSVNDGNGKESGHHK
jgi:hypothetical protein